NIKTIDPKYFSLDHGIERRLYSLAHKHIGNSAWWKCNLPLLHAKTGSSQDLRFFKKELKAIIARNNLPSYFVALDEDRKPNQVIFYTRDNAKLNQQAMKEDQLDWLEKLLQQRLQG